MEANLGHSTKVPIRHYDINHRALIARAGKSALAKCGQRKDFFEQGLDPFFGCWIIQHVDVTWSADSEQFISSPELFRVRTFSNGQVFGASALLYEHKLA